MAMNEVDFTVTLEKDGQKKQMNIQVQKFNDLRNPYPEYEPWNSAADIMISEEDIEKNDIKRDDIIKGIEEKIFTAVNSKYGNELSGLSVDIRPNYNSKTADDELIREYIDLSKEFIPSGETEKFRTEAEKAISYYKQENSYYFPGHKNIGEPQQNKFIEAAIIERIENNEDTYRIVSDAKTRVNETIIGYEKTHNLKSNEQPFFIVMNKVESNVLITTVNIDKNMAKQEKMEILRSEAKGFVLENTKSADQLKGVSVKVYKANGILNQHQNELYQSVGRQNNQTQQHTIKPELSR
jgi:hypothetical protein